MNKVMNMLGGLGVGAGLMYFYDPDRGRRRRSLLRDKMVGTAHRVNTTLEKSGEDLSNRMQGLWSESQALLNRGAVPDWILEERVRARIGQVVRHPGSIEVVAVHGRVSLSGPVLADEADRLVSHVSKVRGVKEVDDHLDVYASPESIPGLQGQPRPREPRMELLQENWSPGIRLLTTMGGSALGVYGLKRGGLMGTVLSTAGLGMAVRGITNLGLKRLLGIDPGRRGLDVQKTIHVNAPVEEVYALWSNFTNFPRFMAHVREVHDLGNGRSHWVVAGPAGVWVEWDALVTQQVLNELIAWKSAEGEAVKSVGSVYFEPDPQGGTSVTVRLSYTPPAGALGHAVAALFGTDPKKAMDEDLVRFKSLIETGKTTAEGREVRRMDLAGAPEPESVHTT